MKSILLSEAKAHLGRYVKMTAQGEKVLICERNRPVAELGPISDELVPTPLRLGVCRGAFEVPDDFDAPLPEFERDYYGS